MVVRRRFRSTGVRSGSVRDPFGVRSGSVRDPFGVRSGSVRCQFGICAGLAAATKKRSPGGVEGGAVAPPLPTAETGFYIIYLLHNLMRDAVN